MLHALSEKFALAIEGAKSVAGIEGLQAVMALEYIDLVHRGKRKGISALLGRVLDHIDFHLGESLALSVLASRFGTGTAALANRFRRELDTTCASYVHARRVDKAAWYLHNTELSIKEIAALIGYSDESWFVRSFRKLKGCPPGEYRRKRDR